jgi:hypothetical protein
MARRSHSAKNSASPFLSCSVKKSVDALFSPRHLWRMKKPKQHPLAVWLASQGRGSLSRLARETGLSPGHIHNIKSGHGFGTDTARKLAKATGIPAAVLMGLENA